MSSTGLQNGWPGTGASEPRRLRRVLVVDDQPLFREALAGYLASTPDFEAVAHSAPGPDLLRRAGSGAELVLVGVNGRTGAGMELVHQLLEQQPDLVVAVLSDGDSRLDDARVVTDAVRGGISAWVPKAEPARRLLGILRELRPGDCYLPPPLLGRVVRASRASRARGAGALAALTPREREVLQQMVDGADREEIATRLFLSPNTVRTHTQNVLAKLDVHSVVEAVAVAMREGLRPSA